MIGAEDAVLGGGESGRGDGHRFVVGAEDAGGVGAEVAGLRRRLGVSA